jgi:hypothetical protein
MNKKDIVAALNALKHQQYRNAQEVFTDTAGVMEKIRGWLEGLREGVLGAEVAEGSQSARFQLLGLAAKMKDLTFKVPVASEQFAVLTIKPTDPEFVGVIKLSVATGTHAELFLRRIGPGDWCITRQAKSVPESYEGMPRLNEETFYGAVSELMSA